MLIKQIKIRNLECIGVFTRLQRIYHLYVLPHNIDARKLILIKMNLHIEIFQVPNLMQKTLGIYQDYVTKT